MQKLFSITQSKLFNGLNYDNLLVYIDIYNPHAFLLLILLLQKKVLVSFLKFRRWMYWHDSQSIKLLHY